MDRLRLREVREDFPDNVTGICKGDVGAIASLTNRAQRRLMFAREAGDEGWYGSFAEVAFNVDAANPDLVIPRSIARLQTVTVADSPVPIRNQWYEYVAFGTGSLRKNRPCRPVQLLSRNNVVTQRPLSDPPQLLAFYPLSASDSARRIFVQGSFNGVPLRTDDGQQVFEGIFLSLQQPLVSTPTPLDMLTGLQKDVTSGSVMVAQIDPNTGEEVELHTMEPGETTAWYRRYRVSGLPANAGTVQVRAVAKLELIPVKVDTDYLLIQEREAIIQEILAVHYSGIDTEASKRFAAYHHQKALQLLNGQLTHYLGTKEPTIVLKPFGSAALERQKIGTML